MDAKRVEIDAERLKEREKLHDYIQEITGREEPFGRNLDAVSDVLSEVEEDIDLIFTESVLREICMNEYAYKVLLVFGRAAEENLHIRIRFQ